MQLAPNSTQMQAGLPVILVCCGAHPAWSCCCPAHLAFRDASPPAVQILTHLAGFQSCWPNRREQGSKATLQEPAFGYPGRQIPLPWGVEGWPLPPSSSWGVGFSWWELPLGRSVSGGFACVCHEQLLGMGERMGCGKHRCSFWFWFLSTFLSQLMSGFPLIAPPLFSPKTHALENQTWCNWILS